MTLESFWNVSGRLFESEIPTVSWQHLSIVNAFSIFCANCVRSLWCQSDDVPSSFCSRLGLVWERIVSIPSLDLFAICLGHKAISHIFLPSKELNYYRNLSSVIPEHTRKIVCSGSLMGASRHDDAAKGTASKERSYSSSGAGPCLLSRVCVFF